MPFIQRPYTCIYGIKCPSYLCTHKYFKSDSKLCKVIVFHTYQFWLLKMWNVHKQSSCVISISTLIRQSLYFYYFFSMFITRMYILLIWQIHPTTSINNMPFDLFKCSETLWAEIIKIKSQNTVWQYACKHYECDDEAYNM